MVITQNTGSFYLSFPANYTKVPGSYKITIENTVSKKTLTLADIKDLSSNEFTYRFLITGSLGLGEHIYKVQNSSFEEIATGLIRVGAPSPSRKTVENPVEYTTFEDIDEGYTYTQTL